MTNIYTTLGQKALFLLDAEKAHGLSIQALKHGVHPRHKAAADPRLAVSICGLNFPNPLGMAAGYDKGGDVPDALLSMGFGHTEIGTVTPRPQPGNEKPRIFRLVDDKAVINRLGFNSKGHDAALEQLKKRGARKGILGVNIGANKTSEDFAADYVSGIKKFADFATYYTINISSPNTPGLRALQGGDPLADLLSRVGDARNEIVSRHIPLFLKIAPDLNETELDEIAKALQKSDFDALIVSNTTLSRTGLAGSAKTETGGLSGKPLYERSTIVLAKMHQRLGKNFPLVGVGGVGDVDTAFQKIEAGASLVQLYTGLIYGGPGLPGKILKGLSTRLKQGNIRTIMDVIGQDSERWAARKIPA